MVWIFRDGLRAGGKGLQGFRAHHSRGRDLGSGKEQFRQALKLLRGSWDLASSYNWGYKSPKWGYPNYILLITLLTKSHKPLCGAWAFCSSGHYGGLMGLF